MPKLSRPCASLFLLFLLPGAVTAEPRTPLVPEDLYLLEGPASVVAAPDREAAAVIRRWIDADSKQERFALAWVEGRAETATLLEPGEPDARSVTFSPDGQWLAVRSTRPRPEGWRPTPPAPPESDAATDIWLISRDGKRVLPLAGPDKPYGRVFLDSFYGNVAFSPDGRRLVFVADAGEDPRSPPEREAHVERVRPDQGEGYTGYGTAQLWIAELDQEMLTAAGTADSPERLPLRPAARTLRRLTDDEIWYGDPQWTLDGKAVICHANKSPDIEAVRYSINKNYDLWHIDVSSGVQRRLTFGPGPEVSPRISPDGRRLICLSSPRRGPHADVFNLLLVTLPERREDLPVAQVLFDHHQESMAPAPHAIPAFPLPDRCWDDEATVIYSSFAGLDSKTIRVDIGTGQGKEFEGGSEASAAGAYTARMARQRRLSPKANRVLDERLRAEDRVVRWKNEDWELEGLLTVPPAEIATPPYPLVLYPHGGPHSRSAKGFNATAHILAAHGYAVFQPNFRGSSGYGRPFLDADRRDLGGGDMRDILAGIASLAKEALIDPERQFVYGVSYGGFMTTWLVGHTSQFRAAVAQNAVTDMHVMWGLSDLQSWTEYEFGGFPWEVADAMRAHSPLTYSAQVTTPTLILHSRDDRRCPLPMGRMFHQALRARGVPTELVIYPEEGHGIRQPRHQVDVLKRTLAWFAAHDAAAPAEIIMLGDSITKGVRAGVTADETFARRTEAALSKQGYPVRITNVGIGGERTDQALARLRRDILDLRPHYATIMYGTNDSYIDQGKSLPRLPLHEYRDNLVQIVERLRRAGITPILMTEPRWGAKAAPNGAGEHPNERLEEYVAACRDVAREYQVPLVDHFENWTRQQQQGQDLGAWTTDQCHPNALGHQQMADQIVKVLQEVLHVSRRR